MRLDGLLIIDKPEGITSAEVVRIVKKRLGCKTGHLGTLDPFASGVLPVCIGEGTKIAQFLTLADKAYSGRIVLGAETDTGDPTGDVTEQKGIPPFSAEQLADIAGRFRGELWQVPPMYSALKREGVPLYKLARRGIEVEREPRRVHITDLQLQRDGEATLSFAVSCSKGTYVRVLAQDIAAALGTVGHLQALRRTRFGPFGLEHAVGLETLQPAQLPLLDLRQSLPQLREICVGSEAARRARQGHEVVLGQLDSGGRNEAAKLIGPDGELAAVVVSDPSGRWRFGRVFSAH